MNSCTVRGRSTFGGHEHSLKVRVVPDYDCHTSPTIWICESDTHDGVVAGRLRLLEARKLGVALIQMSDEIGAEMNEEE